MNKRVLFTFLSAVFIILGTVIAVRFAQGYRPTRTGMMTATGLLSVNSFPNGASVYINGNLTTATDTTLNLSPGDYDIEITKDGYTPWKKKLHVEKELVSQTNAVLFPIAPSLTPLSFTGASNLTPSPDGQQLLFTTASASAARSNGIYVMTLTDSPLALQKGAIQIAQSSSNFDMTKAQFIWSPDSNQVLLSQGTRNVLLATNKLNELDTISDVTLRRQQILEEWKESTQKKYQALLKLFPPEIEHIATQSSKHVFISPDQERILYTATASATLPDRLLPELPAASTQTQERSIQAGRTYVYDRHEDRNFFISTEFKEDTPSPTPTPKTAKSTPKPTATPLVTQKPADILADFLRMRDHTSGVFSNSPQWLPDSKHVILTTKTGIDIVNYDGTNRVTIYAGPFSNNFVYPWPNGSKLIILTNFNQAQNSLLNLYALGLR